MTDNKSEIIGECVADLHRCITRLRSVEGMVRGDECSDDYELWLVVTCKRLITESRARLSDWSKYYGL
jgi:hypothetical protein